MMFHSTLRNQALPQNAHCCIRADTFANTLHGWAFLALNRLHFDSDGQYCAHWKMTKAEIDETYADEEELTKLDAESEQGSMVLEFTHEMWQAAIKAYNVKKPLIAHRDYSDLE